MSGIFDVGKVSNTLRNQFGLSLTKLAKRNSKIIVLDADVAGGTGLHHFRTKYPKRFVQCGIAEQNMISLAGGLALLGYIPVVTTFSVFMLRGFEQARLSISYNNLNVKLVASHPGLDVGPDGGSAQCLEDLAIFRSLPNFKVISPADSFEMDSAVKEIISHKGPVYMRTGRSNISSIFTKKYKFKIGKGKIIKPGNDLTIIACGVMVERALIAAKYLDKDGISARVINMSTIKPIDKDLLLNCANETKGIIVAEDHNILGGLGSAVAESIVTTKPIKIKFVGINDKYGESGEPEELAKKYKIDFMSIVKKAKSFDFIKKS